jgi:hypothetical protein
MLDDIAQEKIVSARDAIRRVERLTTRPEADRDSYQNRQPSNPSTMSNV